MSEFPRRRLLALGGTALTGAIAGCSSSANEDDDPAAEDDPDDEDESGDQNGAESETGAETTDESAGGTVLGDVAVENLSNEQHTINVILEFGDEIEHWSTHDLDAGAGETIEQDWPEDAGEFRAILRLDDGDPVQDTAASWNDPDCLNLLVTINRQGRLATHADTNSGPCGDGDASFDEGE